MKLIFPGVLLSLFVLVFCFLNCTDQQKNSKTQKTQKEKTKPFHSINLNDLTQSLNAIIDQSVIPGAAVGIVSNNSLVYQKGFGWSDQKNNIPFSPQTVHFIASISKTFIGVSIMKLVEMGKLDLDDSVNDIMEYKIENPHFPNIPITVRHLVTHTAGVTDDFDPETVGEADIVLLEELEYPTDSVQKLMNEELNYYRLG